MKNSDAGAPTMIIRRIVEKTANAQAAEQWSALIWHLIIRRGTAWGVGQEWTRRQKDNKHMQSMNRWNGIGRLGRDPELKKTQSGMSVCSFQIAVDRAKSKDKDTAETDWISCVAWNKTAEILDQYAHKGDQVGIDGRLQTRSYEKKDGSKAYVTEVVCQTIQLLGSKNSESSDPDPEPQATSYPSNGISHSREDISREIQEEHDRQQADSGIDISSDDLPF
jgi:single-strand DNA-binding protein